MPEIIRDEKQNIALKVIEKMLDTVGSINTLLASDQSYSISATGRNAKTVKVDIEDPDKNKIRSLLLAYKIRLAKSIETQAKTYRIALSEDEKNAIKTKP